MLKIIDLLLNRGSVDILPLVPSSLRLLIMLSRIAFDTKCTVESSVRHTKTSIWNENSYASRSTCDPLLRKLRSIRSTESSLTWMKVLLEGRK